MVLPQVFFIFDTMEQNYFKDESPEKGMGFIAALVGMLIFFIMGAGIDVDQFLQQREQALAIPDWYFYIIFGIDVLIVLSIILIYFYRKAGIILFPLVTLLHFFSHQYFLSTFLYSDVMSLFVFVGIALLAIIPKWQFFK